MKADAGGWDLVSWPVVAHPTIWNTAFPACLLLVARWNAAGQAGVLPARHPAVSPASRNGPQDKVAPLRVEGRAAAVAAVVA